MNDAAKLPWRHALVTGAAGFIGSHMVDALLDSGTEVTGIDDLSDGEVRAINHTAFRFEHTSVSARPWDQPAIFHLAGRLGVDAIVENPFPMLREHPKDTDHVCRSAQMSGAVVVVASTSEVYALNHYLDGSGNASVKETDPLVVGPSDIIRSGYAVSKLLAEHIALAWARRGVRVVIARLFNVVGPRQRAERGCVLPRFCRAAVRGEPLTVHGDGTQRRCFTHVADIVRALIALAVEPRAWGQIVNVGCPISRSIISVAEDVARAARNYGHNPRIVYQPLQTLPLHAGWQFVGARVPDISRLNALLAWSPDNRWAKAVEETVAYWQIRENGESPTESLGTATESAVT